MRKYLPLVAALSAIKLLIHLVGNRNYGFHRDELLHLSVSEHPAFGYMEFPPMIAWIAKVAHFCFGYSLSGVRIFSTVAGIAILLLCMKIAVEFGGRKYAVLLAGTAVLAFLPFYRNHMLFQPVAFDQLFWTIGFYFLVRYLKSADKKYLIMIGITAGLGMLNKYTFVVWGVGTAIALLSHNKAEAYRTRWLYIAAAVALVMILPNAIWQYNHDFPLLLHLQKLKESQLDQIGPYDFVKDQAIHVFTFGLSLIGLVSLIRGKLNYFRPISIAVLTIFGLMWILGSKSYYFFAAYPVLFAAGAVAVEGLLSRYPKANIAVAVILIAPVPFYLPMAIPVLPVSEFTSYAKIEPVNGHYKLPDDYADMFGWDEQVAEVAKIYNSMSGEERKNCIILAGNYGEAGAIKILGDKYGLPDPVCPNGSFWLWGYGNPNATKAIAIGIAKEHVDRLFQQHTLIKVLKHQYAIDEENGVSVYLCQNPQLRLHEVWPLLQQNVFD